MKYTKNFYFYLVGHFCLAGSGSGDLLNPDPATLVQRRLLGSETKLRSLIEFLRIDHLSFANLRFGIGTPLLDSQ
jgi:hypothetical protein